jgi:hypothetical protein
MAFIKNGTLCDNFDPARHKQWDSYGKQVATEFLMSRGYKVVPNDKNEDGSINFNAADLKATKNKIDRYVEVEAKDEWPWKCALRHGTLDIPARKLKYKMDAHIMVRHDGIELFVTPQDRLWWAEKEENGCKKERKKCWNKSTGSYVENDFLRIPINLIARYQKTMEGWAIVE